MKKLLVLIMVSMLSLTACSGNKTESISSSAASAVTSSSTESQPISESASQPPNVTIEKMFTLSDIANKSLEEVSAILGEPDMLEDGTWKYSGTDTVIENCPTAYYKNSAIEIKFIEDKAGRITVTPAESIPFSETSSETQELALNLIGTESTPPSSIKLQFVRWDEIQGIYEVSVFNKELKGDTGDTVSYIHIITDEKYK